MNTKPDFNNYKFPNHNWTVPEVIYKIEDGTKVPYCKKHNVMLIFHASILADYCPFCSYEEECNHPRCYCNIVRDQLKKDGKTKDTWRADYS